MVECDLAKVEVAGSNPVSRSNFCPEFRQKLSRRSSRGIARAKADVSDDEKLRLGKPTYTRDDTGDRILRLIIPF